MSTRSVIKINYGETKLILYRHHDGYLAEGGHDLACFLKTYPRASKLIKAMINRPRSIYVHDLEMPLYSIEPCADMGEEYTYIINFEIAITGKPEMKMQVLHELLYRGYKSTIFSENGTCEEVADKFYKLCCAERTKANESMHLIRNDEEQIRKNNN